MSFTGRSQLIQTAHALRSCDCKTRLLEVRERLILPHLLLLRIHILYLVVYSKLVDLGALETPSRYPVLKEEVELTVRSVPSVASATFCKSVRFFTHFVSGRRE